MVAGTGGIALARHHLLSKRLHRRWTRLTAHNTLLLCALLFLCLTGGGLFSSLGPSALQSDKQEDLRVSFQFFSLGTGKRSVAYQFHDFGKEAAIVQEHSMFMLGVSQGLFGGVFQPTSDGKQLGKYDPVAIKVNGELGSGTFPVTLGPGDAKMVSADFAIGPEHSVTVVGITHCPMVATEDSNTVLHVSLCEGEAAIISFDAASIG